MTLDLTVISWMEHQNPRQQKQQNRYTGLHEDLKLLCIKGYYQ